SNQSAARKIHSSQSIDGWKSVVSDAARLQKECVACRQQPHPLPGDSWKDSHSSEQTKYQSGQEQEGNEIEQKQTAIRSGEKQQRRAQPLNAASPIIHPVVRGVNPKPMA